MSSQGSVTLWLEHLKDGEQAAAQELWNRSFKRLIGVARRRLGSLPRRATDEEDVLIAALNSFFRDAQAERFPWLVDRHTLWPLLLKITERKAIDHRHHHRAKKRGGGKLRGDSAVVRKSGECGPAEIDQVAFPEPTAGTIAELSEQCNC